MSEIKICQKCNAKNPSSNSFCEQCGAKLPEVGFEKNPKTSNAAAKPAKVAPPSEAKDKKILASPPVEVSSAPSSTSTLKVSWLQLAYIVLLLLTVFTRFDHLGNKPEHHDESMHAFYSFQLYQDGDYEYNPMMHGPFQFHGNALMYYLFGVSDATSRYLAASFGILTVVLAMMMGPFIGRTAAFLATLLIVASPSFMYFDRFCRCDAYVAGATFAMILFLFRYLKSRQPLDLWIAALGFTISFCTKESTFLTMAVMGTYLFIRLLPWFDVMVGILITAIGMLTQLIIPAGSPAALPTLLLFLGVALAYALYKLYVEWKINLEKGPKSPIWDALMNLGFERIKFELIGFVAWWLLVLAVLNIQALQSIGNFGPFTLLLFATYIAFILRFGWLWVKNVAPALTGSLTISLTIFTLLFTTFFTVGADDADFAARMHHLVFDIYNGAFGGLIYWHGQQGVHRGDEPWYYYLIQLPANEMVSFFFSAVAIFYYGLFKRRNMPLFLAYWYVGSLALFSWAGEKMPWLIVHPLLPSLLLTAYLIGDLWETQALKQAWRGARAAAFVIFAVLLTYSIHSAVLLNFFHESDPVESLVYVQSGPDCKKVVDWIAKISYGETGGKDIGLTIEDKCSWPFAWYLRDYHKRGHPPTITSADNPIILTATESDAQAYPILSKAGYVNRKYKLRLWWVPSWFKKGYPSSDMNSDLFFDWLFRNFIPIEPERTDMVDWNDLKNWILYRQVWSDMGSYNMRMWVRPDLAQKYGFTATSRTDISTDYPLAQATSQPMR
ncbi:MAG: flippase activity-associated protein Agl23 [bacterium]